MDDPKDKLWMVLDPEGNPEGFFTGRELDDFSSRARRALLRARMRGACPVLIAQNWDMLTDADMHKGVSMLKRLDSLIDTINTLCDQAENA